MPLLLNTLDLIEVERLCVTTAMNRTGGCKTDAAKLLGIHRTSLARRLAKHIIVQRNSVWV